MPCPRPTSPLRYRCTGSSGQSRWALARSAVARLYSAAMVSTCAGASAFRWPAPPRDSRSSSRFQSSRRSATNSSERTESKIPDMDRPISDSELVVATPERVSFDYQVAGLGTRAIAQILDLLILTGLLVAVSLLAFGAGAATNSGTAAVLVGIIGGFIAVFGYFWISEALWSGQTIGKKVFRLRAVGDRGEPLTFMQAGIRNVVRIVDFLPYGYGVGMVVLFANGKGKRLGDLAAGTIVVKDSDHVRLWQLAGGAARRNQRGPRCASARTRCHGEVRAQSLRAGDCGRADASPPGPRAPSLHHLVRPAAPPAVTGHSGAAGRNGRAQLTCGRA